MLGLQLRHEFRGARFYAVVIDFDNEAHLAVCGVKKAVFFSDCILTSKADF